MPMNRERRTRTPEIATFRQRNAEVVVLPLEGVDEERRDATLGLD